MTCNALTGRRVLVVEDEALIALDLDMVLRNAGVAVVGPVTSLEEAKLVAAGTDADAALLDINLAREQVWPVAEILTSRKVPIIFLTGYATLEFPAAFAALPRLEKPILPEKLLARLCELITAS